MENLCWQVANTQLFLNNQSLLTDTSYSVEKCLGCLTLLRVMVKDLNQVRKYLESAADIINSIKNISRAARSKFGFNVQLIVRVYNDPEIIDSYLLFLVRTNNYNEDFFSELDELSDEFAEDRKGKSGWVTISTDLLPTES
jgi:hypothetical protein